MKFWRQLLILLLLVAATTFVWRLNFSARSRPVVVKAPIGIAQAAAVAPRQGTSAVARNDGGPAPLNVTAMAAILDLLRARLERADARASEAVMTFNSAEAYRRFLDRLEASGLTLLGQSDVLNTVRVRYDSLDAMQRELVNNAPDYQEVGANFLVRAPRVPPPEERDSVDEIPFQNGTLAFLGATGDRTDWGKGITIAVLDSGVLPDSTFGSGRLQTLDVGFGISPGTGANDGHGTAVASLAAGADTDAPGVASAAGILSIRVTDADGLSDIYSLAQAIVAAIDAGAKIVNISMGGYQTNASLSRAIDYASAQGALIVASGGNDQAAQLTWPAADSKVISVGAIDALGQQVSFSNSGTQLQVTAPGYGVQTAWLNGDRVLMDGTSASAPVVAGAIAAVMSENPGMSASDAWKLLQSHTSEGGLIGSDPDYGAGILNVGSTMNRLDPGYVDTAIASHYYDAANGAMVIVVQNRGTQPVSGMRLAVTTDGTLRNYSAGSLAPGSSAALRVPVDTAALQSGTGLNFITQLLNPTGVTDALPANNRRASTLYPPTPK